jgi:ribosome maturation protein SDO1
MSRQINLPINQVRLTNVAVVRMNKNGKRFEIACYRNKVVDYRQGLETDLSEVLQTDRVFTNVSKGEFAKAKDLEKIFGTKNEEEISRMILSKGQLQVSDKERSQQLEKTNAQIADWISKNCVQPGTDRPYTISQIRHAMQQANFSVHPTKPLKRQYLDCVKMLQDVIPIHRAKMELLLLIPQVVEESVTLVETTMKENDVEWSLETGTSTNTSTSNHQYKMVVDPSFYRVLNEVTQGISGAYIEIVTQVVTTQGDVQLETELGHPASTSQAVRVAATGTTPLLDTPLEGVVSATATLHVISGDKEEAAGSVKEEEDIDAAVSQRKQQKKNKKKNKKIQRRDESEVDPADINEDDDDDSPTMITPATSTAPATASSGPDDSNVPSSRKSCNTCGGGFDTPAAYRTHFKSDWHRFNQKLKLKGAAPISEQEFLLCDSDNLFVGIGGDNIL